MLSWLRRRKTVLITNSFGELQVCEVEGKGASGHVCRPMWDTGSRPTFPTVLLKQFGKLEGDVGFTKWQPHTNWSRGEVKEYFPPQFDPVC